MTLGKRAKNILLATATTVVCLLIGIEVAAYLTVPSIHLTSEGDAMVVFDPEIGMVPHPSAHTKRTYPAIKDRATFVFDVYTDDRGARVDGPGRRSTPRTDIMTIGCSFSWGYALPNSETYSSRLSRTLGASVANFSEASYGTVQALQMLRRNRDLAPRLVIYGNIAHHSERNVSACAPSYYPFCLDVSHIEWNGEGKPSIAPPASNGVRRLEQHLTGDFTNPATWLAHGADVIYGRMTYGMSVQNEPDEAKKEQALAFLLREMERTAAAMGSEVLVVFIPTNYWGPSPALSRMIAEIGGRLHFLDLTDRFKRNKEEGGPNVYIVGDGHPSAAAHAIIADEIARYIDREKLLQ
ncbi:MAG: hypothetical protein U1E60_17105 [Reyranellaceae bacterium]